MTEQECLEKMVPPGKVRPGKPAGGVIQIHVTRACDLACFNCTQGSQLGGKVEFMSPDMFEKAIRSLEGYFGVVGVFGGNACLSPHFGEYCKILRQHVPQKRCGLWSNNIKEWGWECSQTFNPAVSNLNVHLSQEAYDNIRRTWKEARPFGLDRDSRHSPCYVAIKDVLRRSCRTCGGAGNMVNPKADSCVERVDCAMCNGSGSVYDEDKAWELISGCDINQHWSALIGMFRGELRAWFCEIAGAQSMLHQHEPDYPDTGKKVCVEASSPQYKGVPWWQKPMTSFADQVRKHCHECGVPLRGHGELSQSLSPESREQVSQTHQSVYKPKRKGRSVELVTVPAQLGKPLEIVTHYLQNADK